MDRWRLGALRGSVLLGRRFVWQREICLTLLLCDECVAAVGPIRICTCFTNSPIGALFDSFCFCACTSGRIAEKKKEALPNSKQQPHLTSWLACTCSLDSGIWMVLFNRAIYVRFPLIFIDGTFLPFCLHISRHADLIGSLLPSPSLVLLLLYFQNSSALHVPQ